MSILIFLAVLFVLILVHELGHFAVAKWTGMRVDEFGIGFPPRLMGWRKGETLYSLNALPIGGFVKILGEDLSEADNAADQERSFARKNKWAQTAVLLAGVTMNALFAWLLFAIVFMIGVPTVVEEGMEGEDAALTIVEVVPGSPAADAGIPQGAVITSVATDDDMFEDPSPSTFAEFIDNNPERKVTISYTANGDAQTAELIPETGVIEDDPKQPAVGVATAFVETVRHSLFSAIYEGGLAALNALRAITIGIGTLLIDAVRFEADLSNVAGPVGIVGLVGDAAAIGFTSLLTFTAVISLNLAVVNLLPFPALDGGRLLFVAIEAVTRRPLNPIWAGRANMMGFALLLLLMLAVTFNDILRLT